MMRPLMILAALAFQGTGDDEKRIQEWIEQLGADKIEEREKAMESLRAAGEKALPFLKKAAESTDAEVKVRAQHALEVIKWTLERQPIVIILDVDKKVKMEFVRIPAGKFTMGDKEFKDATPHEVTLTKDYWMQTTETTQAQWETVMGKNPSEFKGADRPVENVSWNDCQEFLKKLNEKTKDQLKGKRVRLPTEAEWEYACRAGSTTKWCFGDDEKELGDYAWYDQNSGNQTHAVGQKKANAWGLYDMHGNVWEWCEDGYGEYPSEAVKDPTGPAKGDARCLRGGSWDNLVRSSRSAYRNRCGPTNSGNLYVACRAALR